MNENEKDTARLDWLEARGSNWQCTEGTGYRFGFLAVSAPGTQTLREAVDIEMKKEVPND